jgi:hypothetical protein
MVLVLRAKLGSVGALVVVEAVFNGVFYTVATRIRSLTTFLSSASPCSKAACSFAFSPAKYRAYLECRHRFIEMCEVRHWKKSSSTCAL